MTVQDMGRAGVLAYGLSRGGAADRLAMLEAAALLGRRDMGAAIEMAGMGGRFSVTAPTRFALTGAPMRATLDGAPVMWNATGWIEPGQTLDIGAATRGVFGYLSVGGGIESAEVLHSRSAHLSAGIGSILADGDVQPMGVDSGLDEPAVFLTVDDRFSGGMARVLSGPQTEFYDPETQDRFVGTAFKRDLHGNRQGIRLDQGGVPFTALNAAGIVSDVIIPGDIQMTGDGIPFVLGPECQTIGGYPRIGAVIPHDLPMIMQAPPGAEIRFRYMALEDVLDMPDEAEQVKNLRRRVAPLVRAPHDIADLLGYQLISGAISGTDEG